MVRAQCDLSQENNVNDLRGSATPSEMKSSAKSKIIGVVAVLVVACVMAFGFAMTSSSTSAKPVVAKHGPSAPVTDVAQ